MRFNNLPCQWLPLIPKLEALIIAHTGKRILVVVAPGHVFNDKAVRFPGVQRAHLRRELVGLIDVPEAHAAVVAA